MNPNVSIEGYLSVGMNFTDEERDFIRIEIRIMGFDDIFLEHDEFRLVEIHGVIELKLFLHGSRFFREIDDDE